MAEVLNPEASEERILRYKDDPWVGGEFLSLYLHQHPQHARRFLDRLPQVGGGQLINVAINQALSMRRPASDDVRADLFRRLDFRAFVLDGDQAIRQLQEPANFVAALSAERQDLIREALCLDDDQLKAAIRHLAHQERSVALLGRMLEYGLGLHRACSTLVTLGYVHADDAHVHHLVQHAAEIDNPSFRWLLEQQLLNIQDAFDSVPAWVYDARSKLVAGELGRQMTHYPQVMSVP